MKFQFKSAGSLLAGAAFLVTAVSPAMAEVRQHETKQPLSPNISTGSKRTEARTIKTKIMIAMEIDVMAFGEVLARR